MSFKLVASGSVSLANIKLSLVAGTAFADFSAAGVLTPYLNHKLVVTDSAGKQAVGYIKAAGTGETLGGELYADPEFNDASLWDAKSGWSVSGGLASATGTVLYIQTKTALTLYQLLINVVLSGNSYTSGVYQTFISGGTIRSATYTNGGNKTAYLTGGATGTAGIIQSTSALTASFTGLSLKQVLTPSATGVTIVSQRLGTTQNWRSIGTGFNYNDATGYTYGIYKKVAAKGIGYTGRTSYSNPYCAGSY